jgi:hypothetical protein
VKGGNPRPVVRSRSRRRVGVYRLVGVVILVQILVRMRVLVWVLKLLLWLLMMQGRLRLRL